MIGEKGADDNKKDVDNPRSFLKLYCAVEQR